MIPRNWRWSTLENVSDVIMGQSPNGEETTSDSTYIPLIGGAADMGNLFPIITRYTKVPTKLSQKDDVIICVRATLGRPIYSDGVYCLGRGVAAIRSNILIKEYIRYFLINNEQYLYENATGSTFLQITSIKLKSMPIPVPPLDEQQRIVDIIENLFSKLNRAKALAQNIIDNYELRRSAILHKAFTGILTSNWRFNNKIDFDSWQNLLIKNIASIGSGGTPSRKNIKYYNGNIAWVKTGEIYWNKITKTEEYITLEALENSSARIYPVGTVLVAMYGQGLTRGRAAILGIESATNQAVCALQPLDNINNKFLYYFFMANYHNFRTKAFGTNQSNYSATVIGKLNINIPTIKEQKEIVRILDSLLAKEQRTKELAEQILQKIDLMKKSILARAFRGALMTNTSNL